ncbi:hypothetical protein ABIA32_005507 [Streptacidiphilus sp. MAP12-20]|uniref:hypothetical protein n=1 Tax=Streptacidiphilus sp. MAP12-20 TaxID=3156299 RepID=UPI0035197D70
MADQSARPTRGDVPWHWWFLGVWALIWLLADLPGGGYSWHYFANGSTLLFSGSGASPPGGLHLYANYPSLQIGPLAFLCAWVLGGLGGVVAAQFAMMAAGLVILRLLERSALSLHPGLRGRPQAMGVTTAAAGAVFLVVWASLAVHYSHLDDVLALLFVTLAIRALLDDVPALAGLSLGLAVDAKPWALVFLPLALAVDTGRRRHVAAYAIVLVLVAWLPFVLADSGTLGATQYHIVNEPSSALRALGVSTSGTPSWDRPAQLLLGCALGAAAILRRRWTAVPLLGVGARILLDPGVYDYYSAGFLLGTLCWELLGLRRPVPAWSLVSFGALYLAPRLTSDAQLLGDLRLWLVLAVTLSVLLIPRDWCVEPRPTAVRALRLPSMPVRTPHPVGRP